MLSLHAQAIRAARVAVGLTQDQLGRRIGVKGRAVHRWERDATVPTRSNRSALVTAIAILNQEEAERLKAAFQKKREAVSPAPVATPMIAPAAAEVALELAVFGMADELDVSPRALRGALLQLCQRLSLAGVTLTMLRDAVEPSARRGQAPSLSVPS